MPLIHKSTFFQYGPTGKKYYFKPLSKPSIAYARRKAIKQGRAIEISKMKKMR